MTDVRPKEDEPDPEFLQELLRAADSSHVNWLVSDGGDRLRKTIWKRYRVERNYTELDDDE